MLESELLLGIACFHMSASNITSSFQSSIMNKDKARAMAVFTKDGRKESYYTYWWKFEQSSIK